MKKKQRKLVNRISLSDGFKYRCVIEMRKEIKELRAIVSQLEHTTKQLRANIVVMQGAS